MKYLYLLSFLLFSTLFAVYELDEQISIEDQNISFDICSGDYPASTLSLSDSTDEQLNVLDMNQDGDVNVIDIVEMINYILLN